MLEVRRSVRNSLCEEVHRLVGETHVNKIILIDTVSAAIEGHWGQLDLLGGTHSLYTLLSLNHKDSLQHCILFMVFESMGL